MTTIGHTYLSATIGVLVGLLALALPGIAASDPVSLEFKLDTSAINGSPGRLAFNFTDGDGVAGGSVVVFDLAGEAVIQDLVLNGDAAGSLAPGELELGDGAFLSEGLQAVEFGDTLTFRLSLSGSAPAEEFPDQFSFFMLDEQFEPFPTDDPLGADALLVCELRSALPDCRSFESPVIVAEIDGVDVFADRFEQ
jgi:hypothetical protein